jgi:tetratricopeptide (TPR) repeat protein
VLRRVPEALGIDAVMAHTDAVARLNLLFARALEQRGEDTAASEAYGEAAKQDPRCSEAALARARLLRAAGCWQDAADSLGSFCERHPEPDHRDLAEAHYTRARLLAGPLENIDAAIECFERALQIAPGHTRARAPLAGLLAAMPDRQAQAIDQHSLLLCDEPERAASWRWLTRIARGRGDDDAADLGLAVLCAIGAASPGERDEAPDRLPQRLAEDARLEEPSFEVARLLIQHAAEALEDVLPAAATPTESGESGEFLQRMAAALRELAAPNLEQLSDPALSDLLVTLATLSLGDAAVQPSGDGMLDPSLDPALGPALDRALGRWTRRKMRRVLEGSSLEQIRAIDPARFRTALRCLAAAAAVDLVQGDLRDALVQLCGRDGACPTDDLSQCIAATPDATELLRRIAAGWCASMRTS